MTKQSNTAPFLALGLAVSATTLFSACADQAEDDQGDPSALTALPVVDTFDDGDVSDWQPFTGGGATIANRLSSSRAKSGATSMKVTYAVVSGGYAGIERRFSSKQNWSTASGLQTWVYGAGTGNRFLVQIYDAGGERWEYRFGVDFQGWRQVTMPFASFAAAAWQPSGARVDGVRDLALVSGMSLVPCEGVGSGSVYLDSLALAGTVTPVPTPTPVPVPPPTPPTSPSGTIIPLYTDPSDASWTAVAAAKRAHPGVPVVAVINPGNGPGISARANYTNGIAALTSAGVTVVGYVFTSYGKRPAAEVQADMDRHRTFYPEVSGIFFDEMANTAGLESYYAGLNAYANSHGFDFTVGNPGTDTRASYVGTVDVIIVYETNGLPSTTTLGGWHTAYNKSNFGIIPYAVAMDAAFVQAAKKVVGYVYLQNDNLPNPWDTVPTYLGDLVAELGR